MIDSIEELNARLVIVDQSVEGTYNILRLPDPILSEYSVVCDTDTNLLPLLINRKWLTSMARDVYLQRVEIGK